MKIYSTHYHNTVDCKKLRKSILLAHAKKSIKIKILTAYYSASFIKSFFKDISKEKRKTCGITLVVNGFSGKRLKEQVKELTRIKKDFNLWGFKKSSIYINTIAIKPPLPAY